MNLRANRIFITGGSSGIGKGLAEAFHGLGNQVIIAGRRERLLKQTCEANPGMRYFVLDVTDLASIRNVARKAIEAFPRLNCVINNAGIQKNVNFSGSMPIDDDALAVELNTNVLAVMRVCAAFIPHLRKQGNATIVNVSSGLAFVPLSRFPVYCATKAAVHSFSLSLRHQLKHSGIKVIELVPPNVDTELGGPSKPRPAGGPLPMPLETFIGEAMKGLATDADEIAVGPAKNLVAATTTEMFRQAFEGMNR